MSSRVLGLDVLIPGDDVTNTAFGSRRPCKGYGLVFWSIHDGASVDSEHRDWRESDFLSYLEAGGRLFAMGVRSHFEGYLDGQIHESWWALEDVLPIYGMALKDADLDEVQAVGTHGKALVDAADGAWQPLCHFEDTPVLLSQFNAVVLPDGWDPAPGPQVIDLMRILDAPDAVARAIAVGEGWLFLTPYLKDKSDETLARLVDWALAYSPETPVEERPEWVNSIAIGDEASHRAELARLDDVMSTLGSKRSQASDSIEELARWKALVYATGGELETIVEEAFKLLGFQVLAAPEGRADLRLELRNQRVVVEAKGKGKSAAESDAAQLEKWVMTEIVEAESRAKGILVVNGWRGKPLAERTEAVFPNQMLDLCEKRNLCLVSGAQLLCIVDTVLVDPSQAGHYAQDLLDQAGVFSEFEDSAAIFDVIDRARG